MRTSLPWIVRHGLGTLFQAKSTLFQDMFGLSKKGAWAHYFALNPHYSRLFFDGKRQPTVRELGNLDRDLLCLCGCFVFQCCFLYGSFICEFDLENVLVLSLFNIIDFPFRDIFLTCLFACLLVLVFELLVLFSTFPA